MEVFPSADALEITRDEGFVTLRQRCEYMQQDMFVSIPVDYVEKVIEAMRLAADNNLPED